MTPRSSPLSIASVTATHFATLLFADLVRFSSNAKALARSIVPSPHQSGADDGGNFFVPADGAPPASHVADEVPEEEEPQSLLQIISEHLSLALLSRRRADTSEREAREWDRLIVGYLCLLAQWLWEDPPTVRAFLEAGALGMVCPPNSWFCPSQRSSSCCGSCSWLSLSTKRRNRTRSSPGCVRLFSGFAMSSTESRAKSRGT